jgi:hypothetical protein
MKNIIVTRYKNPDKVGWLGYMEPKDKSWIMFVDRDNNPKIYLERDKKTGAVK